MTLARSTVHELFVFEVFSKFFVQKVEAVRATTSAADAPVFTPCPKPCSFESFKPISPEQVLFLIGRALSKTSELDPVSTWLVKECAVILAPFFVYGFNDSLQKGHLIFLLSRRGQLSTQVLKSPRSTRMT